LSEHPRSPVLITDGETFCHEERRDLEHKLEYPEKSTLYYRLTNTDPRAGIALSRNVMTDPHSSVFLMSTRVEVPDERLRKKLRLYALLAPHMRGLGQHNSACKCELDGRPLFLRRTR